MISFLFFSLCMGLSSGIGVIVSNCFGAKKKKNPYCYGIRLLCSASGNDKRIWGKCNGCLSGTTPASIHRPLFCHPDIIFSVFLVICGWSYPRNTILLYIRYPPSFLFELLDNLSKSCFLVLCSWKDKKRAFMLLHINALTLFYYKIVLAVVPYKLEFIYFSSQPDS